MTASRSRRPVVTRHYGRADHHPDTAEHEILLSRIWSDVCGLQAELIACEVSRDYPERVNEFHEAATGELWYLARLFTRLSGYSDKYGKTILHGTAEYTQRHMMRVAGWTWEVTPKQARELRFVRENRRMGSSRLRQPSAR